jgi:hypothetical protein
MYFIHASDSLSLAFLDTVPKYWCEVIVGLEILGMGLLPGQRGKVVVSNPSVYLASL